GDGRVLHWPLFPLGRSTADEVPPHHRSRAERGEEMKRILFGAALLFTTSQAHAIERQHHVGIGGQLSVLSIDDKSTASTGGGLALHYAYGLDDTFNLMVEATSSSVAREQQQDSPDTPRTRPAGVDHAAFGVGYVIDILQWVPYVCVL